MIYHVKLNLDKYIILNLLTYAMTSSVKSYDKMVHLLPKEPCDIISLIEKLYRQPKVALLIG